MSHLGEDVCYLFTMTVVVATFPISIPYLVFVDAINEVVYPFYTPPWRVRTLETKRALEMQKEIEDAYKKTYAYRYSQAPYA